MTPCAALLADLRQRIAEEAHANTDPSAAFGFARALAIIDEEARAQELTDRIDSLSEELIDRELIAQGYDMDDLHRRISKLRAWGAKNP